MKRERRGDMILGVDLLERILLSLPISDCIKCAGVCKLWYGIISAPAFSARFHQSHAGKNPFLFMLATGRSHSNISCMYDPLAARWFSSPLRLNPSALSNPNEYFHLQYAFNPTSIRCTYPSPLIVVALHNTCLLPFRALVITKSTLLHLYDSATDQWQVCNPSPCNINLTFKLHDISYAVIGRKVFFADKSSREVAYFNVDTKEWSFTSNLTIDLEVKHLLITSTDKGLYALAHCLTVATGQICIKLFKVDEVTFECREVSIIPIDCRLLRVPDRYEPSPFKCMGSGNLIYVHLNKRDRSDFSFWVCDVDDDYKWLQVPSPYLVVHPGFLVQCRSFELLPMACLQYRHR